jgi:hypothetical protein
MLWGIITLAAKRQERPAAPPPARLFRITGGMARVHFA